MPQGLRARVEDHPARRGPFRPDDARARRAGRARRRWSSASARACRSWASASACRRCSKPAKKRRKCAAWASVPGRGAPVPGRRARAAHGLERTGSAAASRGCCADLRRAAVRLLRAQLLRAGRTTRAAATCTYERAVHRGARSRQRLRRAVPSGEIGRRWACRSCGISWSCNDAGQTHHSLPRRHRRPRRQGRQLRQPARRRRSGGTGRPLQPRGRRRAGVPRHHRLERRARHHGGRGGAHRAQGLHPAHGGRRHPLGGRCARAS